MRRRPTFRLALAAFAVLLICGTATIDPGLIRAQPTPTISGIDPDDPAPTTAPNTIVSLPPPLDAPVATGASILPAPVNPLILASGFGQTKPGAPITVAAIVRNPGPATDLNAATISVYDATGP